MDATLGVKTAGASQFNVFLSPTSTSQKALRVKTEGEIHKNWPRAHSDFMISSIYGPLSPTMGKARNEGFDTVLWLVDDYIKELTYGNIFIHQKSRYGPHEVITPKADGTILSGITR